MGDISSNFNRSEFACGCSCGFDTVDIELIEILEKVRVHFGRTVTVNSGCRCSSHNKSEGGSDNSQHKKGRAADISVSGKRPSQVVEFLEGAYPECGIGIYPTFVHIDSRGNKARW